MADQLKRCLTAAERYLRYRPRSVWELRQRLLRRGFEESTVEQVVKRLAEGHLLDDGAFARFWLDNRAAFSPRSRWLVYRELKAKGVDEAVIGEVLEDTHDEDSACRAALSRAPRLAAGDYETFRRRLGAYLRRRGFGYEVINRTVDRAWRERSGSGQDVLSE